MLVLLDASGYVDMRNGAAQRTLHMMPRVVAELGHEATFLILCHPNLLELFTARFSTCEVVPWELGIEGGVRRIRRHNRSVRSLCRLRNVSLVLQELRPLAVPIKTIATIHDARFLHRDLGVGFCKHWGLRLTLPQQLRRARSVVVPSHEIRLEITERLGLSEASVNVIPNGVDVDSFGATSAHVARLAALGLGNRPYVLFVGHREPRKNIPLLFRIIAQLKSEGHDHRLVLAGRRVEGFDEPERLRREWRLDQDVVFLEDLVCEDLPALYAGADVFLFPSLYEGFGLPLLEAMASGCPVVAAETPVHSEVAPGRALGDCSDSSSWMPEILRLIHDDDHRAAVVEEGRLRAAEMNWDAPARQLADLIRREAVADAS